MRLVGDRPRPCTASPQCGSTSTTSTCARSRRARSLVTRSRSAGIERSGARLHPHPQAAPGGPARRAVSRRSRRRPRRRTARRCAPRPPACQRRAEVGAGADGDEAATPATRRTVLTSACSPVVAGVVVGQRQHVEPGQLAAPASTRGSAANESSPCCGAPSSDSVLSRLPMVRSAPASRRAIGRSAAVGSPTWASRSPTRRPSMTSPMTVTVVTASAPGTSVVTAYADGSRSGSTPPTVATCTVGARPWAGTTATTSASRGGCRDRRRSTA